MKISTMHPKKKTHSEHRDYGELEGVLVKINETVSAINERQREIENMSQCLQVPRSLNTLLVPTEGPRSRRWDISTDCTLDTLNVV